MNKFSKLKGVVAFDFETDGITKFCQGKIRLAGFSDSNTTFWTDDLKAIAEFLKAGTHELVAHNAVFELRACKENFGFFPKNVKYDTMAIHYLTDEATSHSLDEVAKQHLGVHTWDIADQMARNNWNWATVPVEVLGPYCAKDAMYTKQLLDVFLKKTPKGIMKVHKKILLPLIKTCAKMEYYGIKIDVDYSKNLSKEYQKKMDVYRKEFLDTPVIAKAMRRVGLDDDLNMNSAPQMRKLFCNGLKFKIEEKTGTGLPSVREENIMKFKDHPGVQTYLDWKTSQTVKTNFIDKFSEFGDKDGIIHSHMNPCFVTTGRLSVTKPNMQAIPTNPEVRGMFVSRFKGGCMVSADFKQLEMRLVASESGETRLLDAFKRGDDVHDLTAKLLFGEDFSKEERTVAKRVNFGIVYGAGPSKLVREFNMSWEQAESLINRFNKAYPNLYRWMKQQREYVHKHGVVLSKFGRIRRLGNTKGLPEWQVASIERQAGNFPIQSQGADLTNVCLVKAYREFTKRKLRSRIVLQVHDSIVVDTKPDEKDEVIEILTNVMTKEVPEKCSWLRVKIEIDIQVTERWS